jgi:hypothetical protein
MKMKLSIIYSFIIVLTFHINQSFGQLPRDETNKVVFEDVVKQDDFSKKDIYDKAKLWIVTTLKSGDNMVELGGDESTDITGTGNVALPEQTYPAGGTMITMVNISVNFKFSIFCKDGRYKYKVENFTLRSVVSNGYNAMEYRDPLENLIIRGLESKKKKGKSDVIIQLIHEDTNNAINSLISDLKKEINSKKEDW